MRITKIKIIIKEFQNENQTNHENVRIPLENTENHENHTIPLKNHYNDDNLRITFENHYKHGGLGFHLKIMKTTKI